MRVTSFLFYLFDVLRGCECSRSGGHFKYCGTCTGMMEAVLPSPVEKVLGQQPGNSGLRRAAFAPNYNDNNCMGGVTKGSISIIL